MPYFVFFFVLVIGPMRPVLWSAVKAVYQHLSGADDDDADAEMAWYDEE